VEKIRAAFGALLAQALLGSAAAADQPAAPLADVTVVAPRPPEPRELAGDALPNFIAAHARPTVLIGQLPRWRVGICPLTVGLSPAFNAFVSARLRAVAASVGAPVQPEGSCSYNVQVFFTTEPQQVMDELVKRNSALLGFHYPHQARSAAAFTQPIQGWYVTSTRNYAGIEVTDDPLPLPALPGALHAARVPPGLPGSRLSNGLRSLLVHALMVADTNKVVGHEIGSISDYLAMLVLSQAQSLDGCGQLPSILELMSSNCGDRDKPTAITAGDIAFLRALYSTDLEQPLGLERSDILNNMMKQLNAGPR
jgi:hypothetical protein